jgi:hypothetical protein
MAIIYFEAVNETMKRVGLIAGDVGELGTSSGATASEIFQADSEKQHGVDMMIQMWQEATNEVFSLALVPKLVATATIDLASTTREYALPSDFERVAGIDANEQVMRSATSVRILPEYPGGYLQLLADQPNATDYTGEPLHYAISPSNAATTMLRVDREPTSNEDGWYYYLPYERTINLTVTQATEAMPYSDTVTRSLIPVVSEIFERHRKKEFDANVFRSSLVRALAMSNTKPPTRRYGQRRGR